MMARGRPWLLLLVGVMVGLMAGVSAAPVLKDLWVMEPPAGAERAEQVRPGRAERIHRNRPAEVLAEAVSRLADGDKAGLERLFSGSAARERFAAALAGQLPPGAAARVARADDLNAGAENGHRVPVEVWVDNGREVAGLSGEVAFVQDGGAFLISSVELKPIPLRVTSWVQAVRETGAPGATPRPVPFLGRFRLQAGERRFSVEARTGEVEAE